MITLPTVDEHIKQIENTITETVTKIDFMKSNLNIVGSNADVFLNSIFNTSNASQMYTYLKSSSNILKTVTVPPN